MITVAIGQLRPRIAQPEAGLAAVEQAAQTAQAAAADLLVLPEAFLTGYAIGAAKIRQLAEPADGELGMAVAQIAARNNIAVVYGFAERSAAGEIFNSASFISESGHRLATYRKLHLFQAVDSEQFSPGSQRPPVVRWHGWGVGLAICYDVEFPETVRMLAEDGADLVCTPTANMAGIEQVQNFLIPARAYESQLYIAYANYSGADQQFTYGGTSVVAAPDGSSPVFASASDEEVLVTELSLDTLHRARERISYLADRRGDVYTQPPAAPEPER